MECAVQRSRILQMKQILNVYNTASCRLHGTLVLYSVVSVVHVHMLLCMCTCCCACVHVVVHVVHVYMLLCMLCMCTCCCACAHVVVHVHMLLCMCTCCCARAHVVVHVHMLLCMCTCCCACAHVVVHVQCCTSDRSGDKIQRQFGDKSDVNCQTMNNAAERMRNVKLNPWICYYLVYFHKIRIQYLGTVTCVMFCSILVKRKNNRNRTVQTYRERTYRERTYRERTYR